MATWTWDHGADGAGETGMVDRHFDEQDDPGTAADAKPEPDEEARDEPSLHGGYQSAPRRDYLRRLPSVLVQSVRLVWQAAGWRFILSAFLQVVGGLGAGFQLLAAKALLDQVLDVAREGGSFDDVLPQLVVL